MNVLDAYKKQVQEQELVEAIDNGTLEKLLEHRHYRRINKVKQQLSIDTSINYYNVKHVEKLNSEEYIFYNSEIITGLKRSSKKVEYEEKDGKQYNKQTGEERTEESIKHSAFNSLNRTKQKIYDYALSNDWTNGYFLTITFNQEYVDRYNYKECYGHIKNLIRNIRRTNPNIKYIFVPEMHKDRAWHFHGLVVNCENLILMDSGKTAKGKKIYNINLQTYKYGFTTATKIEDTNKVSGYITKYITKELIDNTKGQHRYLFSKNLDAPTVSTEWITEPDDIELKKMLIERNEKFEQKKVLGEEESPNAVTYYRLKK